MVDHVIGVDIGTTGTKTGIYDLNGTLVADAFEESVLRYPGPGLVEQDPEEIYQSVIRTINSAIQSAGLESADVKALSLDGQMAGIMAIDDQWNAVTHYDSWLDTRCAPWLEQLRPHETEIIQSSGMALAFNHAPKILYWRDTHPDIMSRISSFIQPAAYVAGRMAGLEGKDAFMDRTYLVFSGFGHCETASWNEELLSRFDLTAEKFPRIVEPWDIIGTVSNKTAAETGLAEGTPIAAGCGDQSANVLGAGLVEPGMVFDTSGTAAVFATVIDHFGTDLTYKCLMTCPHVIPGLYFPMAYVAGGGLNLRWFRDAMSACEKAAWLSDGRDPYVELCEMAGAIPPGAEKLLFLPHLSGRNTPNDPDLRGAFLGLTWRHEKPHMFRAIMESIGYEYAFYLKAVRALAPNFVPRRVINIGGGANSPLFQQIKADILGLDYQRLTRQEFGTLGAAIVAGHAIGLFPDMKETAVAFNRQAEEIYAPREDIRTSYEPYVDLYADAIDTVSPFFHRMANRLH